MAGGWWASRGPRVCLRASALPAAEGPRGPWCRRRVSWSAVDEAEAFVSDERVDEERVHLSDVLHHDLKSVEAACLWDLHLAHEVQPEVLVDDAVAGREEGEDVLDEVPLLRAQGLPVHRVAVQVDLRRCPEACLCLLMHLPEILVLDREQDKTVVGRLQQRLHDDLLRVSAQWSVALFVGRRNPRANGVCFAQVFFH